MVFPLLLPLPLWAFEIGNFCFYLQSLLITSNCSTASASNFRFYLHISAPLLIRLCNYRHFSKRVGNVNLTFRPSDNYRQKMNLNLVDQKNINRDVVIAGLTSYLMHSFDAWLGLVCWKVLISTLGSVRGRPSCTKEQKLSKIWS